MSLITKPFAWGHHSTNMTGTPGANVGSTGTSLTAGASNADGSSVALLSALTHDVEYLMIGFTNIAVAAGNGSALADILVDPAGGTSWATDPLINDLLAGQTVSSGNGFAQARWYFFPIWLKSGHSIGVRARTAHSSTITGRVIIHAYGGNKYPSSWWCGQSVTTVGVTAASSVGTNHTAGNSGTYSSWTDFGSTLPSPAGAVQFAVQGTSTDTTQDNLVYFFEFGVASQRMAQLTVATSTSEQGASHPTGPIGCDLASGTQLQVRATCSGTAEALDVAAYAVH